jgi:pimeloyl-ACP methyl ester carboxylesterase
MEKTVLLLHGWPRRTNKNHPLVKKFESLGFRTIIPHLFDEKYKLASDEFNRTVRKLLANKTPDVIVAFSMGGFLTPDLALKNPQSKLVLVATGPYFAPKNYRLKSVIRAISSKPLCVLLNIVLVIPSLPLVLIYKLFNPFEGLPVDRKRYQRGVINNIASIKAISARKEAEIARFVLGVDNVGKLKKIKNQTLIVGGRKDELMPPALSMKLGKYIKNSSLIWTHGEHFNVLSDRVIEKIVDFAKASKSNRNRVS